MDDTVESNGGSLGRTDTPTFGSSSSAKSSGTKTDKSLSSRESDHSVSDTVTRADGPDSRNQDSDAQTSTLKHSSSQRSDLSGSSSTLKRAKSKRLQTARSFTKWIGAAAGGEANKAHNFFADADRENQKLYAHIAERDYDVQNFYSENSCAANIARSEFFGNFTLFVISANAIWMGAETDGNNAKTLKDADLVWQVGEHAFAGYFTLELLIRFLAFESKRNCLKDTWFKFDTLLVSLMIVDTWIMGVLFAGGSDLPGLGNMAILKLLRLLRLSRMARLMRSVPELVTLFKGMKQAMRSMVTTVVLLVLLTYIFGILFKVQLGDNENMDGMFERIPRAMWYLALAGTLLDNIMAVLDVVKEESYLMAFVFLFFAVFSAIMVLNMLIGILCDVVSAVAKTEKEKNVIAIVKEQLLDVLEDLDMDNSQTISRDEFKRLLAHEGALNALSELGIDTKHIMAISDTIFEGEFDEAGKVDSSLKLEDMDTTFQDLSWAEFLECLLSLRSHKQISVTHIMDLRKLIRLNFRHVRGKAKDFFESHSMLEEDVGGMRKKLGQLGKSVEALKDEVFAQKDLPWEAFPTNEASHQSESISASQVHSNRLLPATAQIPTSNEKGTKSSSSRLSVEVDAYSTKAARIEEKGSNEKGTRRRSSSLKGSKSKSAAQNSITASNH